MVSDAMRRILLGASVVAFLVSGVAGGNATAGLAAPSAGERKQAQYAVGVVYHDLDRDGVRDPGEKGLPGVRVSNQREIVVTDDDGGWRLPVDDNTIFFVIKPRGWMTPVDDDNLPEFYYIHKPNGSPELTYAGVEATGPLPESIDFPLYRQEEPDKFRAIIFGDTQTRDMREIEYMAHDVVEELIGTDASFGVTLGDLVFNDLSILGPYAKAVALIGIPWYNVIGNHDINFDATDDGDSDETFERHFGPAYYSFDYGPTHFLVLDNINWHGTTEERRGFYNGGFGPEQMEFVKNDLALIPEDQLVVLMMHIPLTGVGDRAELYRLIEMRPYALSVSAHTHYQAHVFIDDEDGWQGPKPHHHLINVTACGSWWQGSPNENGIPHTTMRGGAPNGYSIFSFDGNQYTIQYKAAGFPATYQMNVYAPESVTQEEAGKTPIYVNVFGGSDKSTVEVRLGPDGEWRPMRKVSGPDPAYAEMHERDKDLKPPYRPLPGPMNSPHLWRGVLPDNLPKGTHALHVRSTDMFGQTYMASRAIRIE